MAGTAWSQWHWWRSMERTMNCPVKTIWQKAALLEGDEVRRFPGHRALWCFKNRQLRKSTGPQLTHVQQEVSSIKESLPISEKLFPTHYPISRKNKKNEPPWNSDDKGHVYREEEAQLSHIRDKHISLCFSCSLLCFCQQDTEAQSITVFLLPVLGAGEDPDSMAIKILQGGSAGHWRSVQLTRVKRVKLHCCDGPSSSHLQGRGWTKEKSTEWWGRRKVCSLSLQALLCL